MLKRLNHSYADQAKRKLAARTDQVQIAAAHLNCCLKDEEALQRQLALKIGQRRQVSPVWLSGDAIIPTVANGFTCDSSSVDVYTGTTLHVLHA